MSEVRPDDAVGGLVSRQRPAYDKHGRLFVDSPLFDILAVLCGVKPIARVLGFSLKGVYYTRELSEDQQAALQEWAAYRALPNWSTGFGAVEAADLLVAAAVENGNIAPPPESLTRF